MKTQSTIFIPTVQSVAPRILMVTVILFHVMEMPFKWEMRDYTVWKICSTVVFPFGLRANIDPFQNLGFGREGNFYLFAPLVSFPLLIWLPCPETGQKFIHGRKFLNAN